ncbi:hypothetical protein [Actinokineospora sp. NBRC 105648]|uniref:alpha/beta hydrolase n=1 Tax=Actinokineospora sp. NBRC 105648 TaxID=3032206 RepID=UPI0024A01C0B|nr:hypothetical protein [Actinokineospora sp. NBRC 105648]GLZ41810.1 hypothetical protein Acsp05_54340 [Actinokineospora sp. NBRC 105648]
MPLAEDLASHGYLVVAVDHTYEAAAVKFPDGRVLYNNRPADESVEQRDAAITVRADDLRFVLTEVERRWSVDVRRVVAVGHSAGGATAAEAAQSDSRFRAALNMDGAFSSRVTRAGVPRPTLLLSGAWDFDNWVQWRGAQQTWGRHLAASGMGHYSFTDAPYFIEPAHLRERLPAPVFAELFGTVAPARAIEVQRTYVRAFLDRHLFGVPSPLLNRATPRFPEVSVRWSTR